MTIDTKNLVPLSEANQNFSKVAHFVDENGPAIIMKNNKPRYVLLEYSMLQAEETADTHDVMDAGRRFIKKHRKALEELAK